MKINTRITIARTSGGEHGPRVSVTIQDDLSCITFFRGDMSLHEYAECITGLGHVPLAAEVRGLEYIGMKRVSERRSIECPLTCHNRKELEIWLEQNAQEEGWLLNTYLGAQDSVGHRNGKTVLNYTVTKYVKEDEQ